VSPQEHLRQAKAALDAIQTTAVTGRAHTQLVELKRHLNALEKASASASAAAGTTAETASPGTRGTRARSNANWGTEVAAMDKILTDLMGTGATTGAGAATGTTGATGTSGTAGSKAATTVSLDEATRAKLMDVRTHLTAYAAAMAGASTTPKSDDAMPPSAPAAAPNQAGNAPAPAGSTMPPATTPSAAAPSAAAPPMTGAQPPAAAAQQPAAPAAQPQIDSEAARRHLTAARDTLSQLTKLPAAAQLTGEARNQVGQLISNFNELITTQSQWRASYVKVAANLTALLGPDTDATQTAGTPPTTPEAAPPAATPGAVGTAGTAKVELDPAIREKLVELRRNLKEFEKASGGAEEK
jgi:hypothetical protein